MNKKTIITLIFALASISANAQFFFRISGKKLKEPSYILGSVHTLPGTLLDSVPEYLKAEAKCQQLYADQVSSLINQGEKHLSVFISFQKFSSETNLIL